MVNELYYSWIVTPENAPCGVYDLVYSILDVLYASYPHGMDFHVQIRVELSIGGSDFKVTDFDFSSTMQKSETQKLLVKGFSGFFGKGTITSITKVIILGYPGSSPFA